MASLHERDIPSVAARSASARSIGTYTQLSFAVATSLAAAKRLTWEQTPWFNPQLSTSESAQVAEYISLSTGRTIEPEAISNALIIGETYIDPDSEHIGPLGTGPQLLLVFPNCPGETPSKNEKFLKIWHDDIVLPAFNRAWEDSGLVDLSGAHKDFRSFIGLQGTGVRHGKEGKPAVGFLAMLNAGIMRRVCVPWPAYNSFWGPGYEGEFSGHRAKLFDTAWKSMMGMLGGHPDLQAFQNPVLIVLSRARLHISPELGVGRMYESVGVQWDKAIDARFLKPGSFKVVMQVVIAARHVVVEQVNEEMGTEEMGLRGVQFKRTVQDVDEVEDQDAEGSRAKRAKRF